MAESVENQGHDQKNFNKTVANNTLVSMASTMIYLVTRVVVPPVTLKYLGVETWGIWSFCFVITGYLGMGAFGITNVYIRYTAIYQSKNDVDGISRLASTGLALTWAGSSIVILGMYFWMPAIVNYFNISEANRKIAFILFYTTTITFLLQLTLSCFGCVLHGLQRIAAAKKAQIIATLTETILIIVGLVAGMGVYALMMAFLVRNILFVILTYSLAKKFLPDLKIGFSKFDKTILPYFWNYGGALQLNGLLGMFSATLDRILFQKFFGERAVGYLDIGQKFPRMAIFIPEAISYVIYPAVTHLQQGEHHDEIEKLYIRGCRYINLIISTLMGFMAPFALFVILVWLGPEEDIGFSPFLMALFTLPFHAHVFTGPASAVFKGLGMPFLETRYPVFKIIALGIGVWCAFHFFEVDEKILATAVAGSVLVSTVMYVIYANVKLKIHVLPFLKRAVLPGFIPYSLGFGMLHFLEPWLQSYADNRWSLALAMLPTGTTFVIVTLILFWVVVFDAKEKHNIVRAIKSKLKRT